MWTRTTSCSEPHIDETDRLQVEGVWPVPAHLQVFLTEDEQEEDEQTDEEDAEDGQSRDGGDAGVHLFSCRQKTFTFSYLMRTPPEDTLRTQCLREGQLHLPMVLTLMCAGRLGVL